MKSSTPVEEALLKLCVGSRSTHVLLLRMPAFTIQRQMLAFEGDVGIGATGTGDKSQAESCLSSFAGQASDVFEDEWYGNGTEYSGGKTRNARFLGLGVKSLIDAPVDLCVATRSKMALIEEIVTQSAQ